MSPRHQQVDSLRARLARVRKDCDFLRFHAGLGRQVRELLASLGSPTWRPDQDTSWCTWIEREGDEQAQDLLEAFDIALQARAARIVAGEESFGDELRSRFRALLARQALEQADG